MKIELVKEVAAPIDDVWAFFNDIPRVVTCMPGASLTGMIDEETFEGTLGMKVGPISVNYQGKMHFDSMDPDTHTVHMTGSGRDKKGAGSAQAKITATLEAVTPSSTSVAVVSDVRLTGRVASLGRGVQDVAGKIFEEFARRTNEELTAAAEQPGGESADLGPDGTGQPSDTPGGPAAGGAQRRRAKGADKIRILPVLWSVTKGKIARAYKRLRERLRRMRKGS